MSIEEQKAKKRAYAKVYYETHKEKIFKRDNNRKQEIRSVKEKYRQNFKDRVFNHYGVFCACCGETEIEFLTIDHINNNGSMHRKEVGIIGGGSEFYRWLTENSFPEGFQTLCMNCNFAKGKTNNNGVCPHQKKLKSIMQRKVS